jgi:hypothetical protein
LNLKSGQSRANNSFLLSRVLRDLESEYAPTVGGLSIEILEADAPTPTQSCLASMATNIWTIAIMFTQLLLSITAFILHNDECVLLLFATAVFLMEALANMPLWGTFKFSARKDGDKRAVYALLRGNAHRHVFVVRNKHPESWNLEDLAADAATSYNYIITLELFVLLQSFFAFFTLTLLATTLSDVSATYFLTILALGTAGNVKTAAVARAPWMHGFSYKAVKTISDDKEVMVALKAFEEECPGLGVSLVKEFFPGGLEEEEMVWWSARGRVEGVKVRAGMADELEVKVDG